jgi:NAD(P)-dependent dehydrogenase (short-subunit alcohol dehydrogenase family)
MSKFYAVIAGAGSGTGASVALRFAKTYPVVLLARKSANYEPIVQQIRDAGGSAYGYTADVSDPASVDGAFAQIEKDLHGHKLAAAVYNANAGFAYKSFLDLQVDDLNTSLGTAA